MTNPVSQQATGLADLPRAVLSAAVGVIDTVERAVVGPGRVRTARGNAWEAVLADRARADHRNEVRRRVATISTGARPPAHLRVGSSPRSRASQGSVRAAGADRS
jgi:hypothetical protein